MVMSAPAFILVFTLQSRGFTWITLRRPASVPPPLRKGHSRF